MFESCIAEIKAATGLTDMTDEEAAQFLDAVHTTKARVMRERALGSNEALREAAKQVAEQHAAAAAIEKRNALLNLQARITRRARIEAAPTLAEGIAAEIHGSSRPLPGARFSAEAEQKALARVYLSGIVTELEKAGLFQAAKGSALERSWARELFELSKGADGKPGVTGSAEALSVAKIINKYQTLAKQNLNRAGAAIGDYSGYVTRTSHDADLIRKAGFENWRATIEPMLGQRTFEGVADHEQFLKGAYSGLITGVHLTDEGAQGMREAPAFTGPRNLAKSASEARVLHFKDADSWMDYQGKFGRGSLIENVAGNLDRAAKSTALMRRWGTNPRAEFQSDLRYFAENMRDSNPDAVIALRKSENTLQNRFDFLDGTANRPVNALGSKIGSTARIVESMAKLGLVAATHLSSLVSKAAELRYHGIGLLEGYGDGLASFVRGRGHGETREIMDLLGAGAEGMRRDMLSRFEPANDGAAGTASKLANLYFKINGLSYLMNAQKSGAEFTLARHLGSMLDRDHAALAPQTQRLLSLYGITPDDWNALRTAPDHAELHGQKYLTPDAATRIASMAPRAQQDLALKLHAMGNDVAERSIITPGIPEHAMFLGGNRPGTALGEGLRFIQQFKSWSAAAVRQGLGREIYGGQSKGQAVAGIMHIAVASTVMGYLVSSIKALAKGQLPPDPSSPKTWAASALQGGGMGILGDYLFGEYSRFGQNFAETLLGPVLGSGLDTALDLKDRITSGKPFAPEALRAITDNAPFANVAFLGLAIHYLFLWHVQNALNPGFTQRQAQRAKSQGTKFWLSPASVH